jgi:hypothetical protein
VVAVAVVAFVVAATSGAALDGVDTGCAANAGRATRATRPRARVMDFSTGTSIVKFRWIAPIDPTGCGAVNYLSAGQRDQPITKELAAILRKEREGRDEYFPGQ